MRTARTAVDQYGTPITLVRYVEYVPTRANDEAVDLQVPMAELLAQRCPEHPDAVTPEGKPWTACRAHWTKHPLVSFKRVPAVMLLCPRGHAWDYVLLNWEEGSHAHSPRA